LQGVKDSVLHSEHSQIHHRTAGERHCLACHAPIAAQEDQPHDPIRHDMRIGQRPPRCDDNSRTKWKASQG